MKHDGPDTEAQLGYEERCVRPRRDLTQDEERGQERDVERLVDDGVKRLAKRRHLAARSRDHAVDDVAGTHHGE